MGLAASQGRYLCLTARMSDLIYEGQQISQQRLALSSETQALAEKYNDAMNNTVMQVVTPEGGTQQLTYDILTSKDPFSGLGMRLVDLDGNVVVPEKGYSLSITAKNIAGEDYTTSVSTSKEFIEKYMPNLDSDKSNSLLGKNLLELSDYYKTNYPDSSVVIDVKNNIDESLKNDDEHFLYDKNCKDPKYLQEMITSGQWLIQRVSNTEESGWEDTTWQGSNSITEVFDTTDDAAAEAEYEAAVMDIQKKDKILELRLEQVQTEENAVEKELDSVKEVIKNNIETSFKTFG